MIRSALMRRWLLSCGVACAALVPAGCANDAAPPPPAAPRVPLTKVAFERQKALGARKDAQFGPEHFDLAGRINSLGREKLRLILQATGPEEPITLYVDAPRPTDDAVEPAESLQAYALQLTRDGQRLEVKQGANPDVTFSAAESLEDVKLLQEYSIDQYEGDMGE